MDDESDVVDLLAYDGLVFVVFPGAREREARVVHLAGVFREVVAQDVVDTSERVGTGLGQFAGPELHFLAVKQDLLVFATHLGEKRVAAAQLDDFRQDLVAVDEVDAVLAPTDVAPVDAEVGARVEHLAAHMTGEDEA